MLLPSSSLSVSLSLFRALFLAPQPRFDTALKEKHRSPLQGPIEHGEDERPPEQEEPHFGSGWGRERASERSLTSREFVPQWSVEVFIFFPFALPVPQFPLFPFKERPLSRLVLAPNPKQEANQSPFSFSKTSSNQTNSKMQSALAATRGCSIAAPRAAAAAGRRSAANVAPAARPCVRVASASAEPATGTEIEFT
jgi:hypothetical protein